MLKPNAPDYWKAVYYFIDDVCVIDVDSLTSIGEETVRTMNIYPNPALGHFTIETGDGSNGTFQLLDMAGREVLSMPLQSSKQQVAIEGIPAGIYMAVLSQKGVAMARRKLVVE